LEQRRGAWVVDVADRVALVRLIQAALAHGVAPLDLPVDQVAPGPHVLQLRLAGDPVVVLAAELAGQTTAGILAFRLAPLDPSHVPELATIAEGGESALASVSGPMSSSASSVFGRKTLPDPEPEMVDDDELQASVLFDPEAAMISRSPPRGEGAEEDELTIPARASMMPPAVTPPSARSAPAPVDRGPGEPNTISHFSFPSMPPITERSEERASSMGEAGPRTMPRIPGGHGIVTAGRVIANRYRIESLLGAGAIGAVYKATHVDLPRTFAIKVLHPSYRTDAQLMQSLRAEARAASLLDHPNVTAVQDFGEEPDGLVYVVMEYLAGANLQVALGEARRFPPERAIAIMLQLCSALAAAHDRGIVHRDVKPDNIMLVPSRDDEGNAVELVKVCDFGIAALDSATAPREWTAGTPEYMAPEQAHGLADARSDVYACGVVLYEMLTGRPPFVGDSVAATLAKHANELPRAPSAVVPGLPPQLDAVVLRALEKLPQHRFLTMRELRAELKRLQ
jgi:tRNA A-37 threonylcarbamoyl transferase component Bud32